MIEELKKDLRLSVSKTKTYLDCQKKYKFSYVLKMPQKDNTYTIFGKFCHKVLEDFHLAYLAGSQELYNTVMTKAFKDALLEYKEKMTPEMKKECFDIINQYLKIVSDDKKNNLSANVLSCEKRFEFECAPNLILNGMIDRVQLDDDGVIHVGDYKTIKNKKYLKNNDLQLLTYAYYMLSQEYPDAEKVRCSYILLRHDFEYVTYEYTREDAMKAKDLYLEYSERILSETEYKPTVSALCAYCSYVNICEEGQKKANIFNGEVNW